MSTTELQSKRSNPNARQQLGVRKEADPSPPNHGGTEFLTYPRQVTSSRLDWVVVLRVVPQGPQCPTRKILYWGPLLLGYKQTKVEPQPASNEQNTLGSNAATKQKLSRNQHASI